MILHPPLCAGADALIFSVTDVHPPDPRRPRAEQARDVFLRMEETLRQEDLTFGHVFRTWFYLDNILDWYDEFNAARSAFFRERKVFNGVVPASTGVGMSNPHGAALVGSLLAMKPRSPQVRVMAVPSPLQCPALNYHSGFSRAVEVHMPERRHLYISGTASIDLHGASVFFGDIDGQIAQTMAVVEALLQSRHMTWIENATRATAYFPDLRDAPRFAAYCRAHGMDGLPVTSKQATICRRELLFEIEVDAVAEGAGENPVKVTKSTLR